MSNLQPYHVAAYNTAKASENKIHDDATAKRFGFRGGLVGGVHVYAYMTHLPVQRWGRAWLERGTGDARFGKPVYEGDIAANYRGGRRRRPGTDRDQCGRALRHRACGATGIASSVPSLRDVPVRNAARARRPSAGG